MLPTRKGNPNHKVVDSGSNFAALRKQARLGTGGCTKNTLIKQTYNDRKVRGLQGQRNVISPQLENWQAIQWQQVHQRVNQLRQRIYRASVDGNLKKARNLQRLMRESLQNKGQLPNACHPTPPHVLRHTFAPLHLANGLQLPHLKDMLGHEQLNTTAIYPHTPLELIKQSIDDVTKHKPTLLQRAGNWLYPKRKTRININTNSIEVTIGRNQELLHITEFVHKNCNTILIGPIGVGKSHLINQIKPKEKKILLLDDCYEIKKALIQCLIYLYKNDKEHVFNLLYGDQDLAQLHQHLQRDSIASLTRQMIKITQQHEYLLVIDNVDKITPRAIKALASLKDHFTILTTAREVPLNKSSFLWNFEIIPIKPLSRKHSLALIQQLSQGIEIEDLALYSNHIDEQTDGNPRAIVELVDRYKEEAPVTTDTIRAIKHIGSSPFIIILLAGLSILRYVSHEADNPGLKTIGSMALILFIRARYFFRFSTRKHL